jgi:hypothetical protein
VQNTEVQTFPTYEIQLRSGKVVNQSNPTIIIQEENDNHSEEEKTQTTPVEEETSPPIPITSQFVRVPQQVNLPPYPEILLVKKPDPPLHRDIEDELRNVCIKIPLLQAIKDIPIYAKIIRDICINKLGRKKKEPPLVQVVRQLSEFIYEMPYKYNDPGNLVVTVEINGISLPNTLTDLSTKINEIPFDTMKNLQINQLRPTQTMIELTDKSVISPIGSLDDVTVTLASWEYPVDVLVIYSKSSSKLGHPVVLGLPWLATAYAFISCSSGEMTISNGTHSQKLVLFPPAQPTQEIPIWLENPYAEEDCIRPLLTLEQVRGMQEPSNEQVLSLFLADTNCIEYPRSFAELSHIFSFEFQQTWHPDTTQLYTLSPYSSDKEETTELVDIIPGKPLYINSSLEPEQKTQVIEMLQRQFDPFAWDYADMKGLHLDTCTHHIYTNDQIKPVRQPQ